MLSPADALKLKCKFVDSVISFIEQRKFISDLCICKLYKPYNNYLLSTIEDCLEYEDVCDLTNSVSTYTITEDADPVITECGSDIPLTLSSSFQSCTYTSQPKNSINGSAYPEVFLTDDSIYANIRTNIVVSNTCNSDVITQSIIGGCVLGNCGDQYLGTLTKGVSFHSADGSISNDPNSYFRIIRVYETDSNGQLTNIPIDLNLHYGTSIYYGPSGSCPGCSTLALADVKFGSATFVTSFNTLMNNVSLARYGVTGKHAIYVTKTGTIVNGTEIGISAKNNPAGNWFGLHTPDVYVEVFNTSTSTSKVRTFFNVGYGRPIYLNNNDIGITLPCGILEPHVKTTTQATYGYFDVPNASFNSLTLVSPYATSALYNVCCNTMTCNLWTLTATYSSNPLITSVSWTNSLDEEISTTNTVQVAEAGDYTFTINTSNGCTISDTITIS